MKENDFSVFFQVIGVLLLLGIGFIPILLGLIVYDMGKGITDFILDSIGD